MPETATLSPSLLPTALLRVLRRPRLWLGLWLLSLGISLCGALPAFSSLSVVLARRPLAEALARGQADVLWVELLSTHPTLAPALGSGLLGAAALYWLITTALYGGLLAALRRPGDPRRAVGRQVIVEAARTWRRMLGLGFAGLLLRLPVVLLLGGALFAMSKWAPGRGLWPVVLTFGAQLLVILLLWSVISVVLHYARLHLLDSGPGRGDRRQGDWPLIGALGQGLRQAVRSPREAGATLLLAAASLLGLAIVIGGGRLLALRLDHAMAIGLAFAWRQLGALARQVIALSVMAGAVEVADSQQVAVDFPGPSA